MFRLLDALSSATSALKSYILLYREERRREASAHNQSTVTCRVPQEIMASCFYFLLIRELVRASHVCRAWRDTALAFPMLWSFIELDRSHVPLWYESEPPLLDRLLATVLARAKDRPVFLIFSSALSPSVLSPILDSHMHHLLALAWASRDPISSGLVRHAPLLEVAIFKQLCPIPPDLFGGSAPRLRMLLVESGLFLPVDCPALENLTELDASASFHTEEQAQSLGRIFVLMPRLQTLTLSDISPETHRYLPAGPAAHTLERVTLACDEHCDLVATLQSWRPPPRHFQHVFLCFELACWRAVDLRVLFDGAADLTVSWTVNFVELNVVAVGADERAFSLYTRIGRESDGDCDEVQELLRQHLPHLRGVHTLRAPPSALSSDLLNALPALAHVTVVVDKWTNERIAIQAGVIYRLPELHFDCAGLAACLLHIPAVVASLRVRVSGCDHVKYPTAPTLGDLDAVVAALVESLPRRVAANATLQETPLTVQVTGFPPALVENFALPSVAGYCIAFGDWNEDSDSDDG